MTAAEFAALLPLLLAAEVALTLALVAATLLVHAGHELARWRAQRCDALCGEALTMLLMGEPAHLPRVPWWLRAEFVALWTRLARHVRGESIERLRAHLLAHGAAADALRLLGSWRADRQVSGCDAARVLALEAALPRLRALAGRRDPLVRQAAWHALLELDPLRAFPALADQLVGSERWNVARHSALFKVDATRAASALAAAALAAPPGDAAAPLRVLAEGDDPAVLEVLLARYRGATDPGERAWCLYGIGRFGSRRDRPLVLGALADADDRVRWQAVAALGRLAEAGDLEHLARALRDRSFWVRQAAAEALLHAPGVGRAALEALLERIDDVLGRDALAAALARSAP